MSPPAAPQSSRPGRGRAAPHPPADPRVASPRRAATGSSARPGSFGGEYAGGLRLRNVALVRVGPEDAIAQVVGDAVPEVLVLEVVEAVVSPDPHVGGGSRPVCGVDQEV